MNIVVSIKQVPNTSEVKPDQATGALIREDVPSIINPDDKAGLEAALRLKDQVGAHATVLIMGPPQAAIALREALAVGTDEAVLVTNHAFDGANTWTTSSTLVSVIAKLDYNLIITGRQAIDGDTTQVGPQIAEHLSLPNVSYAKELWVGGDTPKIKRQYGDRYHIIRVKAPCPITALAEVNEPHYMTPGGIFDAFQKKITEWHRVDLDVDDSDIGLKSSSTRVEKSFTKVVKGQGTVITMEPEESANWLTDRLCEKFILQQESGEGL